MEETKLRRTKYPDAIKMDCVKRALAGEDTGEIALSHNIPRLMVAKWARQVKLQKPKARPGRYKARLSLVDKMRESGANVEDAVEPPKASVKDDDQRMLNLKAELDDKKAELAEVKIERDMLKAMLAHYLAKDIKR